MKLGINWLPRVYTGRPERSAPCLPRKQTRPDCAGFRWEDSPARPGCRGCQDHRDLSFVSVPPQPGPHIPPYLPHSLNLTSTPKSVPITEIQNSSKKKGKLKMIIWCQKIANNLTILTRRLPNWEHDILSHQWFILYYSKPKRSLVAVVPGAATGGSSVDIKPVLAAFAGLHSQL